MSESIKTFWFDLQRFAVTLFLDEAGAGKSKYVHANDAIPAEDPTDEETGKAAKGQYFWETENDQASGEAAGGTYTKITFSTATKESATYTVESGESTKEKSFNYYTVALDDARNSKTCAEYLPSKSDPLNSNSVTLQKPAAKKTPLL